MIANTSVIVIVLAESLHKNYLDVALGTINSACCYTIYCTDNAREDRRISRRTGDRWKGCRTVSCIGCGGHQTVREVFWGHQEHSDAPKSVCTGNRIVIFREHNLIRFDDHNRIEILSIKLEHLQPCRLEIVQVCTPATLIICTTDLCTTNC